MDDVTYAFTSHTYTESFAMTQEIRIPQARHRLNAHEAYLWQCYDASNRLIVFGDHQYHLDCATGEFWMQLLVPLPKPLHGMIVLSGILEEG